MLPVLPPTPHQVSTTCQTPLSKGADLPLGEVRVWWEDHVVRSSTCTSPKTKYPCFPSFLLLLLYLHPTQLSCIREQTAYESSHMHSLCPDPSPLPWQDPTSPGQILSWSAMLGRSFPHCLPFQLPSLVKANSMELFSFTKHARLIYTGAPPEIFPSHGQSSQTWPLGKVLFLLSLRLKSSHPWSFLEPSRNGCIVLLFFAWSWTSLYWPDIARPLGTLVSLNRLPSSLWSGHPWHPTETLTIQRKI